MNIFRKRKLNYSVDSNTEVKMDSHMERAKKIDRIYKLGAGVLIFIWLFSFLKPSALNFKFDLKSIKNIRYIFNEKRGNTLGNDSNSGMVVQDGKYIYYVNHEDDNKIYRIKDGTDKRELFLEDSGEYLNIINGVLYYINRSDKRRIYKVNLKTKEKERVGDSSAFKMVISGGWIYYLNVPEDYSPIARFEGTADFMNLFRIRLSGKDKECIIKTYVPDFNVYNGKVYYQASGWRDNIYCVDTDGSSVKAVIKETTMRFWMDNKYIYAITDIRSEESSPKLMRYKHDGTDEVKLYDSYVLAVNSYDDSLYFTNGALYKMGKDMKAEAMAMGGIAGHGNINIAKNYVYYGNDYTGLYRIKVNEKKMEKEPEVSKKIFIQGVKGDSIGKDGVDFGVRMGSFNINAQGDWIYYSWDRGLVKCKADGSESKIIFNRGIWESMQVSNGYIYYVDNFDMARLFRIKEDGSERSLFFNEKLSVFKIYGDYLFYKKINDEKSIYKIKLDGTENEKIFSDMPGRKLWICRDSIYYLDNSGGISKSDLSGRAEKKIIDENVHDFHISNNNIYYSSDGLYKMNLDTKGKMKICDLLGEIIEVREYGVFFIDSRDAQLYSAKDNEKSLRKIMDMREKEVKIVGDYIYLRNYSDGKVSRMTLDGKEIINIDDKIR